MSAPDSPPALPAHPGPAGTTPSKVRGPGWVQAAVLLLAWGALSQVPAHPALHGWLSSQGVTGSEVWARARVGVMALGLSPYLGAFVLVELVAWAVPPWRRLRVEGREVLQRWALRLSWTAATAQAFELARWVEVTMVQHVNLTGWDDSLPANGKVLRGMVMAAVLLGFGLTLWMVRRLGSLGLGHGITVWLAAALLVDVAETGRSLLYDLWMGAAPVRVLGAVLLTGGVAGAFWFILRHPERLSPPGAPVVRLPPSGVMPVVVASSLAMLPVTLQNLEVNLPRALREPNHTLLLVVAAVLMGRWFLRGPGSDRLTAWVRWRAVGVGTLLLLGVTVVYGRIPLLLGTEQAARFPAVSSLLLGVAAWLDVVANARAWRQRPDWVTLGSFQHVMRVDAVLDALREAHVPAFATALHARTALQWFGPYLPVDVLVPRETLAQARLLLDGPAAPAPAPSAAAAADDAASDPPPQG